jgi:predicted nucleic acid-binding protein
MKRWFADSFYFFALMSNKDENHARAVELAVRLPAHLFTTAWVLTELADGFCKPSDRAAVAAFIRSLEADPNVTIAPADPGSSSPAWCSTNLVPIKPGR